MKYIYLIIHNIITIGGAYIFAKLAFEHHSVMCGIGAALLLGAVQYVHGKEE